MDKAEFDLKISDALHSILAYCIARTSSYCDAEDLAQDIVLELTKSRTKIRDEKAFYGFMWSVAGNVYSHWCRKKRVRGQYEISAAETETADADYEVSDFIESDSSEYDIYLLRRELSLLKLKYRRATVLYYIEDKSCAEIAEILSFSESMVKYLLFKSRKILLEGMNMDRNYGEQSYNPKGMKLLFWGRMNNYGGLCDKKIVQNILMACYNDALSEKDISLALGVAVPYIEDELDKLVEYDLLRKSGSKYQTNIVIFTQEFAKEVNIKTAELSRGIAEAAAKILKEKEAEIRSIGFTGSDAADMSENTYMWQIGSVLLCRAIMYKLQNSIEVEYPIDKFGEPCFVWGNEIFEGDSWSSAFGFGKSDVSNSAGDIVEFMDFPINGDMVHHHYFANQSRTNVFLDIANNRTDKFSENDMYEVSEMVRMGHVLNNGGELKVNAPVYTKAQYEALLGIIDPAADEIMEKAKELIDLVTKILVSHTPSYLRDKAKKMGFLRIFEDTLSVPVSIMYKNGVLKPVSASEMLPTTYVVLNK